MKRMLSHLERMRRSGWFDILIFLLSTACVMALLGLLGYLLEQRIIASFTPEMTEYERQAALGTLTKLSRPFLTIAAILAACVAISLIYMRFISPLLIENQARQRAMRKLRTYLQHAGAFLVSAIILFPIYWMLISAMKTSDELLQPVPTLWPVQIQWTENFKAVLNRAPFGQYFINTIISTFFIMVSQLLIGIFAAYGFSKGKSKGKDFMFIVVLGALMIPIQVTFVPIYVLISKLGWINTFQALIVPNLVSAYFIFLLRQSFMAVDDSYLEAGKVDGMGRIGAVFYVLVPMCKPTLITVSIITFINGWNSYFWPKMVTTNDARRTIAVGVNYLRRTFAGVEVANYNEIMAGAVLAVIPVIILFLLLQKYIMTGLSKAAMK